jgi:hypothetical protein
VIPGPPTLSGGSVTGLAKGKPVVKFRLAAGANGGHKLHSFKVKLPAGLASVAAQLRKGVKVTGGGKVTVTPQLVAKAAGKRAGTLRVVVTATPVNGTGHLLSFTVKNPSCDRAPHGALRGSARRPVTSGAPGPLIRVVLAVVAP